MKSTNSNPKPSIFSREKHIEAKSIFSDLYSQNQPLSPVSSSPSLSPEFFVLEETKAKLKQHVCRSDSENNSLLQTSANSFDHSIGKFHRLKHKHKTVISSTLDMPMSSLHNKYGKKKVLDLSLPTNTDKQKGISNLPKSYNGNTPPADYRKSFRPKSYKSSTRKSLTHSKHKCIRYGPSSHTVKYEDISADESPNCFRNYSIKTDKSLSFEKNVIFNSRNHPKDFDQEPFAFLPKSRISSSSKTLLTHPKFHGNKDYNSLHFESNISPYVGMPSFDSVILPKECDVINAIPCAPPLPTEAILPPPPLPDQEDFLHLNLSNKLENINYDNSYFFEQNSKLKDVDQNFVCANFEPQYSKNMEIENTKLKNEEAKHFSMKRKGFEDLNSFKIIELVGEGTYGTVFKAIHAETSQLVALKKVRTDNEKEGFPITAVREIKILNLLRHDNVIELLGIISNNVCLNSYANKSDVYLVFEYMDHDLMGLLYSEFGMLNIYHIQLIVKQVFEAVAYCHSKNFLHRDLKCSNILINNKGTIKLADFGLARFYNSEDEQRMYTNKVITLWYRAPELLLGEERYGPPIDMWSCGCIFAELFDRETLFVASREIELLDKISQLCGTPSPAVWPEVTKLPLFHTFKPKQIYRRRLKDEFEDKIPSDAVDFLDKLLILDPNKRLTALQALNHQFLRDFNPSTVLPLSLPTGQDCHELSTKKRRKKGEVAIKRSYDELEFKSNEKSFRFSPQHDILEYSSTNNDLFLKD